MKNLANQNVKVITYNDNCKGYFPVSQGVYHGLCSIFYPSGKKKTEVEMRRGRKHGYEKMWTEEGTLIAERRYLRGRLHGFSRVWDEKGGLIEACQYYMGIPEGEWRIFGGENALLGAFTLPQKDCTSSSRPLLWKLLQKNRTFDPQVNGEDVEHILSELKQKNILLKTGKPGVSHPLESLFGAVYVKKKTKDGLSLKIG